VRCPSATFLAELRAREDLAPAGPLSVLAVAGAFDAAGRPLAGAVREIRWLAGTFAGVDAVVDTAAGPAFGGRDPGAYGLLHLAAHAEVDPQRPWNSALILGDAGRPRRLRAGAIADLDLTARLAVLASCNSASGAVLSGEGMLGLAAGFLSAGVPAVVATLWSVDDRRAEQFTRLFYAELADGRSAAAALQRTRAALRARPGTSHPDHWAGYVLLGEGSGRVPLVADDRPGLATWIAVGGTLVAAVVTVLARRRGQRSRVKGRV
jgi:CHAT domain-containing protein